MPNAQSRRLCCPPEWSVCLRQTLSRTHASWQQFLYHFYEYFYGIDALMILIHRMTTSVDIYLRAHDAVLDVVHHRNAVSCAPFSPSPDQSRTSLGGVRALASPSSRHNDSRKLNYVIVQKWIRKWFGRTDELMSQWRSARIPHGANPIRRGVPRHPAAGESCIAFPTCRTKPASRLALSSSHLSDLLEPTPICVLVYVYDAHICYFYLTGFYCNSDNATEGMTEALLLYGWCLNRSGT